MATAQDIVRNAVRRDLLRERQAGNTRRSVYRLDNAYIAKRFEIPRAARAYRRPWLTEDACLRHLGGEGAPRTCGCFEQIEADHRIAWLVKEHVGGTPLDTFSLADLPAAARLLAHLHRRGIITDDATPGNFLKTPAGSMVFLDLGRAKRIHLPGPWLDGHIGWELAKLRREGFGWDPALWAGFRPAYFQALSVSRPRRALILAACAAAIGLRMARKTLQGKSPRS